MINWQIQDREASVDQTLSDMTSREKSIITEIIESFTRFEEILYEEKDIKIMAENIEKALNEVSSQIEASISFDMKKVDK
jgi:hypothetical protein